MLHLPPLRLADEALLLRPLREDDAPGLSAAAAESRDAFAFTPVPDGLDDARAYVAHALAALGAGQRYPFAIEWHGRVVGTTSYYDYQPWRWPPGAELARPERPDGLEIGYTWLAASVQRTRCNTLAKRLLLQQAFEGFEVHRVALRTDVRNQRSRRAIERLGAKLDGVLRAHMAGADGTVRDSAYYSILRAEWPEVKARLGSLLAEGV